MAEGANTYRVSEQTLRSQSKRYALQEATDVKPGTAQPKSARLIKLLAGRGHHEMETGARW